MPGFGLVLTLSTKARFFFIVTFGFAVFFPPTAFLLWVIFSEGFGLDSWT